MPKEGLGDKVLDKLHERAHLVREKLAKDFKGTKPFRMEQVPNDKLLWIYDNMSPEDLRYAVDTYGEHETNQWMMEMEKLKGKVRVPIQSGTI